jgi:flavin reductase (DIM6/NTAB) family NADH-FMN oxidoreductase RutF
VKQVDYIGLVSGNTIDKFQALNLTAVKSTVVDAPYVEEFPVVLECKVIHTIEIGLHIMFVGQIMDLKADSSVLSDRGFPDIKKVKPIVFDVGTRGYHAVGARLGKAFSIGKDCKKKID